MTCAVLVTLHHPRQGCNHVVAVVLEVHPNAGEESVLTTARAAALATMRTGEGWCVDDAALLDGVIIVKP